MGKGKPSKYNHKLPERRVTITYAADQKLDEILKLLKEMDSRSRVLFAKVHNMQVEFATLQKFAKSLAQFLVERDDSAASAQARREQDAIIRQFLFEKYK